MKSVPPEESKIFGSASSSGAVLPTTTNPPGKSEVSIGLPKPSISPSAGVIIQ